MTTTTSRKPLQVDESQGEEAELVGIAGGESSSKRGGAAQYEIYSRSESTTSSHTSYQDLPACLHDSFNECRTRLANRLSESFERIYNNQQKQNETSQTISGGEDETMARGGGLIMSSFYAAPLSPIQPAATTTTAVDNTPSSRRINFTTSYNE